MGNEAWVDQKEDKGNKDRVESPQETEGGTEEITAEEKETGENREYENEKARKISLAKEQIDRYGETHEKEYLEQALTELTGSENAEKTISHMIWTQIKSKKMGEEFGENYDKWLQVPEIVDDLLDNPEDYYTTSETKSTTMGFCTGLVMQKLINGNVGSNPDKEEFIKAKELMKAYVIVVSSDRDLTSEEKKLKQEIVKNMNRRMGVNEDTPMMSNDTSFTRAVLMKEMDLMDYETQSVKTGSFKEEHRGDNSTISSALHKLFEILEKGKSYLLTDPGHNMMVTPDQVGGYTVFDPNLGIIRVQDKGKWREALVSFVGDDPNFEIGAVIKDKKEKEKWDETKEKLKSTQEAFRADSQEFERVARPRTRLKGRKKNRGIKFDELG